MLISSPNLPQGEEKITRLTYRDTFLRLAELGVCSREFAERVARSVGLRDILVHAYNAVDLAPVHRSVRECLQDYGRYVAYVTAFLDKLADSQDTSRNPWGRVVR